MMDNPLVALTYFRALKFLSLDVTGPFYADLGVPADDGESLRLVLRTILQHGVPSGTPADVLNDFNTLIGDRCDRMSTALGAEAIYLSYWVEDIFYHDHNPWAAVESAFSEGARRYRQNGVDLFGFSEATDQVYESFRRILCSVDSEAIESRYSQAPSSEWDRLQYESVEIRPPISWNPFGDQAVLSISLNRFQQFWMSLRESVSDAQSEAITRWAARMAGFRWPPRTSVRSLLRRLPNQTSLA